MPLLSFSLSEQSEAKLVDMFVNALKRGDPGFTLNFNGTSVDWNGIKVEKLDVQICFYIPKEPKYDLSGIAAPSSGDPGAPPL